MNTEVLLDVREIPARERHPKIFKAWEELPVGGVIRLVNDHDPKPLYYEFSAERAGEFEWTPVNRGPESWSVEIKRVAKPVPEARPAWAAQEPSMVVDVREDLRAKREPFEKILGAAMATAPGGVFAVRALFEPAPLYAVLGSKGFESWGERLADDDWKAYFRRKPSGGCACGGRGHG